MTLFSKKAKNKDKDAKMVGGYIPLALNTYLTLYSMATEESKNTIFTNLIQNWKEELEEDLSLDVLIEDVREKAVDVYRRKRSRKGFLFTAFFNKMKKELEDKGIDAKSILLIMKGIIDAKNK